MACLVEIKSCPNRSATGSATCTSSACTSGSSNLHVNATRSNALPHPRQDHRRVSSALRFVASRCERLCQPQRQWLRVAVLLTIALLVAGSCKAEVQTNQAQGESHHDASECGSAGGFVPVERQAHFLWQLTQHRMLHCFRASGTGSQRSRLEAVTHGYHIGNTTTPLAWIALVAALTTAFQAVPVSSHSESGEQCCRAVPLAC